MRAFPFIALLFALVALSASALAVDCVSSKECASTEYCDFQSQVCAQLSCNAGLVAQNHHCVPPGTVETQASSGAASSLLNPLFVSLIVLGGIVVLLFIFWAGKHRERESEPVPTKKEDFDEVEDVSKGKGGDETLKEIEEGFEGKKGEENEEDFEGKKDEEESGEETGGFK
ncbi:MAG: hypothetical protein V1847_04110 [Candidatus Diapherotrites archaeon]